MVWLKLFKLWGAISDKDIFCPHCGVKLGEPITQSTERLEPSGSKQSGEGQARASEAVSNSSRRKPALIWLGFISILTSFLLFVLALSHFPSEYWDQGGEIRWYEISGTQIVNGEIGFAYSLIPPEKGKELTKFAINKNPSIFTGSLVNEMTYLLNVPGGEDFRRELYGMKGYENLAVNLAAFEVIPGTRPRNGFLVATAGMVFGLILIMYSRGKMDKAEKSI